MRPQHERRPNDRTQCEWREGGKRCRRAATALFLMPSTQRYAVAATFCDGHAARATEPNKETA